MLRFSAEEKKKLVEFHFLISQHSEYAGRELKFYFDGKDIRYTHKPNGKASNLTVLEDIERITQIVIYDYI